MCVLTKESRAKIWYHLNAFKPPPPPMAYAAVRSKAVVLLLVTPGRRQSKTPLLSLNVDKIDRNRVFACHLSRMPIKNTVFIDFRLLIAFPGVLMIR